MKRFTQDLTKLSKSIILHQLVFLTLTLSTEILQSFSPQKIYHKEHVTPSKKRQSTLQEQSLINHSDKLEIIISFLHALNMAKKELKSHLSRTESSDEHALKECVEKTQEYYELLDKMVDATTKYYENLRKPVLEKFTALKKLLDYDDELQIVSYRELRTLMSSYKALSFYDQPLTAATCAHFGSLLENLVKLPLQQELLKKLEAELQSLQSETLGTINREY